MFTKSPLSIAACYFDLYRQPISGYSGTHVRVHLLVISLHVYQILECQDTYSWSTAKKPELFHFLMIHATHF